MSQMKKDIDYSIEILKESMDKHFPIEKASLAKDLLDNIVARVDSESRLQGIKMSLNISEKAQAEDAVATE